MKVQFEKDNKPNPIYNKIIVAKITEKFSGLPMNYFVLYASMHRHPHYHINGAEIPISEIIEWAEI